MKRKMYALLKGCILLAAIASLVGCGSNVGSTTVENSNASQSTDADSQNEKEKPVSEAVYPEKESGSVSETAKSNGQIAVTDLEFSTGFAFESNGDGTCTIIGMGTCTDKDIVIPDKSPEGDTVTLIDEYAFYSLEDVDSITLVNCNYEVDESAFQYGEFTALNIIGGNPVIKKSAFSSCGDLISISFNDCNIQAEEYAFYSIGKDADVIFSNCTGVIGESAFQYSDLISLSINDCQLEIEKSAFSSCDDLASIIFTNSIIETEEYAFYSCGDSAHVEMTDCSLILDDNTFQYSSLDNLTITGSDIQAGKSVFSSCEDLSSVNIDCNSVDLGEYAFYSCEDLTDVMICENTGTDNKINIDDSAFQYCKRLNTVTVGKGTVEIGKYVFSGCSDDITITIAGENYTADSIKDGLK